MSFRACERRVLSHERTSNGERPVTRREVEALVATGLYQSSTGSPTGATHWRRPLADGSCLHLVVEPERCRLHHDAFDPHGNLMSLMLHMTHEARSEAVALTALAWSVVSLLAQRRERPQLSPPPLQARHASDVPTGHQ